MTSPEGGRLTRLDADGNPVGDPVELKGFALSGVRISDFDLAPDPEPLPPASELDVRMTSSMMELSAKAAAIVGRMRTMSLTMKLAEGAYDELYRLFLGEDEYRRWQRRERYMRRAGFDAPRRKNKHGRKGVRRRRG